MASLMREFFTQPDQDSVRTDLALFFGPRSHFYLDLYTRTRRRAQAGRPYLPTWSWWVFLGWNVWFWYRKLWLHGLLALLVPIAAGYFGGDWAFGAAYILACMFAKNAYLGHALRTLARADATGRTGQSRTLYLRRKGGVSWPGAVLATFLLLLACAAWTDAKLGEMLDLLSQYGIGPPG